MSTGAGSFPKHWVIANTLALLVGGVSMGLIGGLIGGPALRRLLPGR